MSDDPKHLVATSYDMIADTYLETFGVSSVRSKWLHILMAHLPASGGRVLDLGCGAGVPVARALVQAGHSVVGVDSSAMQIAKARELVPDATFVHADMGSIRFEDASFDAVCAFYAITHLPAAEQGKLFRDIAGWLEPGGVFVASLGCGPAGDWTGEWLGTPMFFSHAGEERNLISIEEAGLVIERAEVERQDNEDAAFLWVVATAPKSGCV